MEGGVINVIVKINIETLHLNIYLCSQELQLILINEFKNKINTN